MNLVLEAFKKYPEPRVSDSRQLEQQYLWPRVLKRNMQQVQTFTCLIPFTMKEL